MRERERERDRERKKERERDRERALMMGTPCRSAFEQPYREVHTGS